MIATELVAHGGTASWIAEGSVVLGLLVLVLAVWRSERRARHEGDDESWTRFRSHLDDR